MTKKQEKQKQAELKVLFDYYMEYFLTKRKIDFPNCCPLPQTGHVKCICNNFEILQRSKDGDGNDFCPCEDSGITEMIRRTKKILINEGWIEKEGSKNLLVEKE
jgi:hypothetical protein